MLSAATHPLIFVDREALGELHNSNYVQRKVPPGPVIIEASFPYLGPAMEQLMGMGPMTAPLPGPGPPQSFPECVGLDALRLGEAKRVDLPHCIAALEGAEVVVGRILWPGDISGKNAEEAKRLCHISPSYGTGNGQAANLFDRRQVENCRHRMNQDILRNL